MQKRVHNRRESFTSAKRAGPARAGLLRSTIAYPMNTFLRKYHTGLLTLGIYLLLTTFALLVSFGLL